MHAKPQFRVYVMHDLGALRRARPTAIAVPLVVGVSLCCVLLRLFWSQSDFQLEQLVVELQKRNVKVSGKKAELIERLTFLDSVGCGAVEPEEEWVRALGTHCLSLW